MRNDGLTGKYKMVDGFNNRPVPIQGGGGGGDI